MRGGKGVRLAALTGLTLACVLLLAGPAFANGGIQGTTTRGGGGGGMNNSRTAIYTAAGGYVGDTGTAADGRWSISLPAGDYIVLLQGINASYANGWWRGAGVTPHWTLAQTVTVSDGTTQTCDGTLPLAGTITGTVTSAITHLNTNATVSAYWYNVADGQWVNLQQTNINGPYTMWGLFPGTYKLSAGWSGWVTDYYNAKSSLASADTTVLVGGGTTTYSPALLPVDVSSGIHGVVHHANGTPAVNVGQYVYRAWPDGGLQWISKFMNTRADGSWDVTLTPGTYKVVSRGGFGWASGYWASDGLVPLASMGETVTISLGVTSTVDATSPVAAVVGGTIRRRGDGAVFPANAQVAKQVLNPDTGLFEQETGTMNWGDGTWGLNDLLPGTYKISFEITGDRFVKQFWDNKPDAASADAVTVVEGQQIESMDVTMCAIVTSESVAGDSRVLTAIEASKRMYPSAAEHADAVIITTGWNWPDALGASALAGTVNGPVLLNAPVPAAMPASLDAEVVRLQADGATDAYILGDANAVSAAVETRLRTIFGGEAKVHRLGGVGRYATSLVIADEVRTKKAAGWDGTIFLAKGTDYPDALAASPLAAKKGWPVLLAETDANGALSQRMRTFLDDHAGRVVILGSTSAVPATVASSAAQAVGEGNVERWYGADRFGTSVDIAEHSFDEGMSDNGLGFANAFGYPDALCGGAYLAKKNNPLLLTAQTGALRESLATELTALYPSVEIARFLGGTPAVPQTMRDAIVDKMR